MVKSKRAKPVSLTKVKRKGRPEKEELITKLKTSVEGYSYIYLISLQNQRNAYVKQMREQLKPGRIFYGKNKVMQLALGTMPENEMRDSLHLLSRRLQGERGLLFSNDPPEQVIKLCASLRPKEYARSGYIATESVELEEGALPFFPHSIEPQLRKLGMPTILRQGTVHLLGHFNVCKKGKPLTPAQAQLLKLLGNKMSEFCMRIEAYHHDGKFCEASDISDNDCLDGKPSES
eukprot:GHVQ01030848.1.p1 GENE.GHVQ01030848.1~~GHVQ01030848.1.p1  ORF type:complete len:233 (-),score=22.77 GHVQ01030848.1:361-1059(-)